MKKLLIVTEDVVKLQTLTGIIGKIYSRLYINWLRYRLVLTILALKPFFKVKILTADVLRRGTNCFTYGDELPKIHYARDRKVYLNLVGTLLDQINGLNPAITKFSGIKLTDVFANRLTIFLTYHYFVYHNLYQNLFKRFQPDRVLILGKSPHEQIAELAASKLQIKIIKIPWLNLNTLNQRLNDWLQTREHRQKINHFLAQGKTSEKLSKKISRPIILSLDFHRHLKTLAPLYAYQKAQKLNPLLVTDIANLKSPHSVYLASFSTRENWQEVGKLIEKFDQLLADFQPKDFFQKLSLSTTKQLIKHSLVLSYLYLRAADNLFKKIKPRGLVVVSDARFLEQSLSLTAKNYRVPSVMASPNTLLDLAELSPYGSTDKVALVGDFVREKLIRQGVQPERLQVVGDLRLENPAVAKRGVSVRHVYQKLKIDSSKKIILLISFRPNWLIPLHEKKAFVKMAAAAVKTIPDAILVVKPHPTEKRYRVLSELKSWGLERVVISDNNQLELFDLLNAASVVLQTWSMTIFEAIMLNRPVIVINPFNKNYALFSPIIKTGGAIEVTSQEKLNYWLGQLTDQNNALTKNLLEQARETVTKFIRTPDGKVAKRVTDLLLKKS